MSKRSSVRFCFIAVLALALVGCAKTESDATMSEMAAATVSGAVNSSSGGSFARLPQVPFFIDWKPVATAYAGDKSCPLPDSGVDNSNCTVDETGKVMSLIYESCNYGNNSAVWNGTEFLASSEAVTCGRYPSEAAGATLLRTFAPGTTRTIGNSVHIAQINTTDPSGYATPVSGGTLMTFKGDGGKSIAIQGVQILSQKVFRGNGNQGRVQTEADHTVSTEKDQPLEVAPLNGNRVVNGTVKVQHNLEKYTGVSVFKDVTYSKTSGCCLPLSGTITTSFSGSRTGTEVLVFSGSDCGAAKLENEKGESKDITLNRCF